MEKNYRWISDEADLQLCRTSTRRLFFFKDNTARRVGEWLDHFGHKSRSLEVTLLVHTDAEIAVGGVLECFESRPQPEWRGHRFCLGYVE